MIVVTGATGNVGEPLVRALAAAGEKVTAVSRRPPAEVPAGVRHERADLTDPAGLRPVLDGADALFLLVTGEMAVGAVDPRELVGAMTASGMRRIVLLSSQGVRTRPDGPGHAEMAAFEDAVHGSGVPVTALRPGGFASNAFAWAEGVRTQRTVAAPFGDVRLPVVDPADIAEVAAATLTGDGHAGRTYELTGPAPVSPREQAAAIAGAVGAPVRFVELSRDEARARMLEFMPAVVVEGTLAILGEPTADEQRVSPDVERVLGRPPRTFAEWATRNVGAFR
jgi:uncharacterized protein YbjT (DUF2867 family)